VIKTRSTVIQSRSDFTIDDINEILDTLSGTARNIKSDSQRPSLQFALFFFPSSFPSLTHCLRRIEHGRILKRCFTSMTASEMKWLIRIILRGAFSSLLPSSSLTDEFLLLSVDLKIGMGEKTIFNRLHPDAMEYFNTCSDIKRVCWKLYNLHDRLPREVCFSASLLSLHHSHHSSLQDSTISLGNTFRPMLAWRAKKLTDIVKAMKRNRPRRAPDYVLHDGEYADDEFIIEEKLDGERMQLHKMGNKYKYASRSVVFLSLSSLSTDTHDDPLSQESPRLHLSLRRS
jgi:DNA ligase-4